MNVFSNIRNNPMDKQNNPIAKMVGTLNTDNNNYVYDLKPIGNGAYARVYLGSDNLEQTVAIKHILLDKININLQQKLSSELTISTDIIDDNVVRTYEVVKNTNEWFLIMEYCNNGTLFDVYKYLKNVTDD